MNVEGAVVVVTGGASGLGLATAKAVCARGGRVVIADLPESAGQQQADDIGKDKAIFVPADVTDTDAMTRVFDTAEELGVLRGLVHCAGRGGALRIVDRDGNPGSLEHYEGLIRLNLVGTFNALRLAAARMAKNDVLDEDRGVCVLTSSVAAYEGQIGQAPYASAKAGIVGLTLVAARDLASKYIRVCTIAPGIFDTPLLARLPENVRESLGKMVPHPSRLGTAEEFAKLAMHIFENTMLNGETIRLDGAIRMQPK